MSKRGILDALRDEERGGKPARKGVATRKRTMSEEQRKAVSERMRNDWASRRAEMAPAG